jgi:hypothetical protein
MGSEAHPGLRPVRNRVLLFLLLQYLLMMMSLVYLFLQKQKIGAKFHIYLEEGTYHKRLFRGPSTNDMKK